MLAQQRFRLFAGRSAKYQEEYMRLLVCLLAVGLLSSVAIAGEVYGTILDDGKAIAEGVKVEVIVAGKSYAGETDKLGTYHVFAAEKGKGTLSVHHNNQKLSADIFSFEKSTRYDWMIEIVDGKPILKRK
jgi:hypothetical protein